MNTRTLAANFLYKVIHNGESLSNLIPADHEQKPLLQEICFGSCRYYYLLKDILNQLLDKPLKDAKVEALLITSLYQLKFMKTPDHAVINEAVKAAQTLRKPWAKGLTNAVLRNYLRKEIQSNHNAHPDWMIEKIQQAWSEKAEMIFANNNQKPPMTLRVNTSRISEDDYLEKLKNAGINATKHEHSGIVLETPCDVINLPGFKSGLVSVQDASAQLAASLLPVKDNDHVLDACAAPGGKTAHLLELHPELDLTSLDIDKERLWKIKDNLNRLKLKANVVCDDASSFQSENLFDAILCDAPCSATGVIRRHPDIKLLRRESDIKKLSELQLKILKHCWTQLKPGGHLLYCTCSIFPDENEQVIDAFLKSETAKVIPIEAEWGHAQTHGCQVLSGEDNMDGFYYCLLQNSKA